MTWHAAAALAAGYLPEKEQREIVGLPVVAVVLVVVLLVVAALAAPAPALVLDFDLDLGAELPPPKQTDAVEPARLPAVVSG